MKALLTLTLFSLLTLTSFAQQKYDLLKTSRIFLKANNKLVEVYTINRHNIQRLLGKPLKIQKINNEISDDIVMEYVYPSAKVYLSNNKFEGIDMRNTGWYFIFKIKNGFSKPFGIGTAPEQVKEYFPNAWTTHQKGGSTVYLSDAKGRGLDEFISFEFKNGKISWIILTPNES